MHKLLGIDYGQKRIGLATANSAVRLAVPQEWIEAKNESDALAQTIRLIIGDGYETVVVGLPRGLDGQETEQTRTVREFAEKLGEQTEVTIVLQDEADTSNAARERIKSSGKKPVPGELDSVAAALILQDYLEKL